MCYNNEQQVGWQSALNQVHWFHCHLLHCNSEWLLLTITMIDDCLSINELWYTKSELPNWVVLQPTPPSTPLVYSPIWLCDSSNIMLTKYFLQLLIEDIIFSDSFIMLKLINTRSLFTKNVIIQQLVCYIMLHAAYKIRFILTQNSVIALERGEFF